MTAVAMTACGHEALCAGELIHAAGFLAAS